MPVLVVGVLVSMALQFRVYSRPSQDEAKQVDPDIEALVTSVQCTQLRSNLHAHTTITLALLAELVFGNRPASAVIAEQARALWVADELVLFAASNPESGLGKLVGGNEDFSLGTQWEFGSAPSEYQIVRLVFRGLGFSEEAAREYMRRRPLPIRIPVSEKPPDYLDRVVAIERSFLRFERDAVEQECPDLKECLKRTESFQRPARLKTKDRPPRTDRQLDSYIMKRRGDLQEYADRGDREVVRQLVAFWNNPSSDSLWKAC